MFGLVSNGLRYRNTLIIVQNNTIYRSFFTVKSWVRLLVKELRDSEQSTFFHVVPIFTTRPKNYANVCATLSSSESYVPNIPQGLRSCLCQLQITWAYETIIKLVIF